MGKVNIKIEEIDLDKLRNGTSTEFMVKYLLDKPTGTFDLIYGELQAYYEDEGGSPVVSKFEIVPGDCFFDPGSNTGKAMLRYTVQYHFGCSDLTPSTDIAETCSFSINEENSILSLSVQDKPQRDTVDEF